MRSQDKTKRLLARMTLLPALGGAALTLGAAPKWSARDLCDRALAASGAVEKSAIDCVGTCTTHGANERFEFNFKGLRFVDAAKGVLDDIAAYDGNRCWIENWSGIPHPISLAQKDSNLLVGWVVDGAWALKNAPVEIVKITASKPDPAVILRVRGGELESTLTLDGSTLLPKTLKYWSESGDETWTFAGYRSFAGHQLPTGIYHSMTQQTDIYSISEARKVATADSLYEMPRPNFRGTSYNEGDEKVPFKKVAGYMFVHPLVNGQDLGWFFLDTGAEVMCLDTDVAKKKGFEPVGDDITAGVVAVTRLPICRADSFQLGPISFAKPTFYELDMSDFNQAFGFKVAGVCGFDFIGRGGIDIDPQKNLLTVYPPDKAVWPSGTYWLPITFNGDTPCVECEFDGGHRGIFSLDTGSDSNVDFFSPIVNRLSMLKGKHATNIRTGGAGGETGSKEAAIADFTLGGRRFENPLVGMQLTKKGVFASPYLDGNVGMGFLGKFKLMLDYAHMRVGFIPID